MVIFLHKQLMVFFLVVVLLLPLNSIARDVTSGKAEGSCACQLTAAGCSTDAPVGQSDHSQDSSTGECCDCEDCNPEASEPPVACNAAAHIPEKQHVYFESNSHIPTVYLAIFVPPEP